MGVPIAMCCPDGLYFNAELDMCDWPSNVACRSLGIPVNGSCDCDNNGGGSTANDTATGGTIERDCYRDVVLDPNCTFIQKCNSNTNSQVTYPCIIVNASSASNLDRCKLPVN